MNVQICYETHQFEVNCFLVSFYAKVFVLTFHSKYFRPFKVYSWLSITVFNKHTNKTSSDPYLTPTDILQENTIQYKMEYNTTQHILSDSLINKKTKKYIQFFLTMHNYY